MLSGCEEKKCDVSAHLKHAENSSHLRTSWLVTPLLIAPSTSSSLLCLVTQTAGSDISRQSGTSVGLLQQRALKTLKAQQNCVRRVMASVITTGNLSEQMHRRILSTRMLACLTGTGPWKMQGRLKRRRLTRRNKQKQCQWWRSPGSLRGLPVLPQPHTRCLCHNRDYQESLSM